MPLHRAQGSTLRVYFDLGETSPTNDLQRTYRTTVVPGSSKWLFRKEISSRTRLRPSVPPCASHWSMGIVASSRWCSVWSLSKAPFPPGCPWGMAPVPVERDDPRDLLLAAAVVDHSLIELHNSVGNGYPRADALGGLRTTEPVDANVQPRAAFSRGCVPVDPTS